MNLDSVCIAIVMLLSLAEVVSACLMNLDGTSVAFVSLCLLTISCLPAAVFFANATFWTVLSLATLHAC